jgi:hypothetical protein
MEHILTRVVNDVQGQYYNVGVVVQTKLAQIALTRGGANKPDFFVWS